METTPCRAAEMNRAMGRPFQSLCWGEWGPRLGTQARFLELCPCLPLLPGLTSGGTSRRALNQPRGKAKQAGASAPGRVWGARRPPQELLSSLPPPAHPKLLAKPQNSQVPANPSGSTQVLLSPRILVTKGQGNNKAPPGFFLKNQLRRQHSGNLPDFTHRISENGEKCLISC